MKLTPKEIAVALLYMDWVAIQSDSPYEHDMLQALLAELEQMPIKKSLRLMAHVMEAAALKMDYDSTSSHDTLKSVWDFTHLEQSLAQYDGPELSDKLVSSTWQAIPNTGDTDRLAIGLATAEARKRYPEDFVRGYKDNAQVLDNKYSMPIKIPACNQMEYVNMHLTIDSKAVLDKAILLFDKLIPTLVNEVTVSEIDMSVTGFDRGKKVINLQTNNALSVVNCGRSLRLEKLIINASNINKTSAQAICDMLVNLKYSFL